MRGKEIKEEVDKIIEEMTKLHPVDNFILLDKMVSLQLRLEGFQHECEHNFVDGFCVYCRKGEK